MGGVILSDGANQLVEDEGDKLQLSDARLLAGLRSGEAAAFESLFARHWRTVYAVLFRLLGSREEAEDLAQEVFVRLYGNPPDLREQPNLAPWLYRVATNLGYNALRKGGREARRLERAQRLSEVEELAVHRAVDPEGASVAAEERRMVRSALAQISEREQACLVLRHSGLSYAEVAAALGVQTGSVGTLLARAEERFRRVYERLQEVSDGVR
ncbi:MAG: sigma-70 family RNA polymerase sigma factor [Chloroflexota bacterium]